MQTIENLRIKNLKPLIAPNLLSEELPMTDAISSVVSKAREQAANIIHQKDDRLLVIVGPCSIHDPKGAIEYAQKLIEQAKKYEDDLCLIMRVYFEKPRTTIGWKGLINDPDLDDSFNINKGLRVARNLLLEINALGLPVASEFLDTFIPQYIANLISWAAIGARTTESQVHRELASGLSMPLGFKNGTTGNIKIAVDAIRAGISPHHFLGVTGEGIAAIVSTKGNPNCHIILRGSNTGPNYDPQSIASSVNLLTENKLSASIMVDCSHGNSNKDYKRQSRVVKDLCGQISSGSKEIFGLMIESNLVEGNQKLDKNNLDYGKSITDACIGWEKTEEVLAELSVAAQSRRKING